MSTRLCCFSRKINRWGSAFLSHTPGEAFADRIGAFRMIGSLENLNRTRCSHTSKARPTCALVFTNQRLRRLPIRGSFSQRYAPPRDREETLSRLRGSPCVIFRSMRKKAKSGRKKRSVIWKRVASPDLCCVIAQKGRPLLSSWLVGANLPHVLLDGSLAHKNA